MLKNYCICVLMVIWKHMCIERYEIEMNGLSMRSKWLNVREETGKMPW